MLKKFFLLILSILTILTYSSFTIEAANNSGILVLAEGLTKINALNCSKDSTILTYDKSVRLFATQSVSYLIDVEKEGNYLFAISATLPDISVLEPSIEILLDDVIISKGVIAKIKVGYQELPLEPFKMSSGKHKISIRILSGPFEYDYFKLERLDDDDERINYQEKTGSYKKVILPTIIQAENFDFGNGQGYSSYDGINHGGKYRVFDGIDIYEKKIDEGYLSRKHYINLMKGEYTKYTFYTQRDSVYALYIAVDMNPEIEFYFDDNNLPVNCVLEGNKYFPETHVINIYLNAGTHSVTLKPKSTVALIDYIRFENTNDEYITIDSLKAVKVEDKVEAIKKNSIYKNLYVSANGDDNNTGELEHPFKTIERAKQEIAKLNIDMTGDIVVNIMPGYYKLTKTEVFGMEHSGKNGYNVIIKGFSRIDPPVISGGTEVSGWVKYTDVIWKVPAPNAEFIRNLYINDSPAVRARSKYSYIEKSAFTIPKSDNKTDGLIVSNKNFPQNFAYPEELEFVWAGTTGTFTVDRYPVKQIKKVDDDFIILMKQPFFSSGHSGTKFYIENAMELLDQPGEFYYDKREKMIYYYPYKAENMLTAKTYIGETEYMLKIVGENAQKKVSNIVFDNLKIKYGAWFDVSRYGHHASQSDRAFKTVNYNYKVGDYKMMTSGSQLAIGNATNIIIKNCEFSCLGSGAISMMDAVSDSRIEGNIIKDISGTGIIVGNINHVNDVYGLRVCKNIDIKNNVIHRIADEYYSTTAISVYNENNINITHNDIRYTPYTGITVGWGWVSEASDYDGSYKISKNYIQDVMMKLDDGAGIYILGRTKDSEISYNYLRRTHNKNFGMIYLDAGSSYMKVHNNVIDESTKWFSSSLAHNVHDNKIFDNYANTDVINVTKDVYTLDYEPPFVVNDGKWPQKAVVIMDDAGLEADYKNLLELAKPPAWKICRGMNIPTKVYQSLGVNKPFWIEAEDFIEGGEGVAFHKILSPIKNNNDYRTEEVGLKFVDVLGSYVVEKNTVGEWLKYKFKAEKTGTYNIDIMVSDSWTDTCNANIYIDDELVLKGAAITRTLSNEYKTVRLTSVNIKEGEHTVKVEFGESFYFDAIRILDSKMVIPLESYVDENYDEGILEYEE